MDPNQTQPLPSQPLPPNVTNYSDSSNSQSGSKLKFVISGVVIFIILASVGVFFFKDSIFPNKNVSSLNSSSQQVVASVLPSPSLTPIKSSSPSAFIAAQPVVVPGWSSYTYKPMNLSLQYPPGLKVLEYSGLIITPPGKEKPEINLVFQNSNDLNKLLDRDVGPGIPTTTVSVAGHQGFQRRSSLPASKDLGGNYFYAFTVFINNQGKTISVNLDGYSKGTTDDADYATYDKLVSTIKELQ